MLKGRIPHPTAHPQATKNLRFINLTSMWPKLNTGRIALVPREYSRTLTHFETVIRNDVRDNLRDASLRLDKIFFHSEVFNTSPARRWHVRGTKRSFGGA